MVPTLQISAVSALGPMCGVSTRAGYAVLAFGLCAVSALGREVRFQHLVRCAVSALGRDMRF